MPKYMGVDFPLYQEPKTKVAGPTTPVQQRVLTDTAHYWPPEGLPFACATACVQVVLQRSREANAAYSEVIKALELPGCQVLIKKAKIKAPDINAWSSKTIKKLLEKGIKSLEKGKDMRDLPWLSTAEQCTDNADILHFYRLASEFVRVGFNCRADLAEERPKVLVENAPSLFFAITFRAVAEYCEIKLENWNKYRTDDIDLIMTGNPSTKPKRLKKREILKTYKRYKWALRHDTKLLKYADQWYKCRVNPGTIEAYLDKVAPLSEKGLERSNVSAAIASFDEATGYPRK